MPWQQGRIRQEAGKTEFTCKSTTKMETCDWMIFSSSVALIRIKFYSLIPYERSKWRDLYDSLAVYIRRDKHFKPRVEGTYSIVISPDRLYNSQYTTSNIYQLDDEVKHFPELIVQSWIVERFLYFKAVFLVSLRCQEITHRAIYFVLILTTTKHEQWVRSFNAIFNQYVYRIPLWGQI